AQNGFLFDETVFDNIRYGRPTASRDEIEHAARRAHAHEFIEHQLPHGYQTRVGAGGKLLSGGQRQRIVLARAILRDPDILLLDEATSQIDIDSERLIHASLREFTRNRTTILITHRPELLALADRVVVLEAGEISDVGTHRELLKRSSFIERLEHRELRASA
ncbi:MAG TPA: ATP-binding cassette domain-containing protein, partial [Pirellulaceae bacterium]